MDISNFKSPLKFKPVQIGKARLFEQEPGYYVLTYNDQRFMGYNTNLHWHPEEFIIESNLAFGKCITTGLGLGLIQSILMANEKVTEVVVYEKNQDVIEVFLFLAQNSNLDISKLNIVCQDANTIKNEKANCIFIDHYETNDFVLILNTVKNIADNNNCDILWYWPAALQYMLYCAKTKQSIDENSFYKFSNYINVKSFPNKLDNRSFEQIINLEKTYKKVGNKFLFDNVEIANIKRNEILSRKKFNKEII